MDIRNILNAKALSELLDAAEEFCQNAIMRDNDDECMELKAELELATENDYLTILSSYMAVAEDGDEVIEAICEFVANCRTFAEPDMDIYEQVSKEEFEAVLDHCEEVCGVKTCIETEYKINTAEIPLLCSNKTFVKTEKNNAFNIFLPRIGIFEDKQWFVSKMIADMLFDVINKKLGDDYILKEINRYIPLSRRYNCSARELFSLYFIRVITYVERKPDVYDKFDSHMQSVIAVAYYNRMIQEFLCRYEK